MKNRHFGTCSLLIFLYNIGYKFHGDLMTPTLKSGGRDTPNPQD